MGSRSRSAWGNWMGNFAITLINVVYQDGNITGALINGAAGEKDAAHIEQILYDLLLETDEHHVLEARLMLFRLLQEKPKLDTLESVTRVRGVAIDPNLPVGFFDNYSGLKWTPSSRQNPL
jgi:hypothetical protein